MWYRTLQEEFPNLSVICEKGLGRSLVPAPPRMAFPRQQRFSGVSVGTREVRRRRPAARVVPRVWAGVTLFYFFVLKIIRVCAILQARKPCPFPASAPRDLDRGVCQSATLSAPSRVRPSWTRSWRPW